MRPRVMAMIGPGVGGGPGGHMPAYELDSGPLARHLQASGAHLYFRPYLEQRPPAFSQFRPF